ncbi:MAG: hypothetical protein JWN17_284 [Frankiales bacterium]|nr:hypothetical protein [Frankiales bacterium]
MSRDLVTSEGVDDASAKGTAEGLETPAASGQGDSGPDPDVSQEVSAASPGPTSAGLPEQSTTPEGGGDDVLGEAPRGAPVDETQAAGPVDTETQESRAARAEHGTGQQYQVGEG